jgi:2,4-diketo-3-deoxy-L-fuconate hydrolase
VKLIRFGPEGQEKPGILVDDRIVDLRQIFPDIPDIGEAFFMEGWPEKISHIDDPGRTMDVRIGAPVYQPSKIICLGKNYIEHAREGGMEPPPRPLIFCKSLNTLTGPFDPIILPRSSGQIDWEVELAVVIGKKGKRISEETALDYVAGYTVLNDVSGREAQFGDSQWFRGKSFDSFAPVGPVLVTRDDIDAPHDLRLTATVNGEVMQDGTTRDLIFSIPYIIENISEDITLNPGDIISTGTPAGVGIFRDPPVTLKPGDVVACEIEKIGKIRNRCIEYSA